MEQILQLYSQLPLEAKIGYGLVGIIVIAGIVALIAAFYWSVHLMVAAPIWLARKFGAKPGEKNPDDDDSDTPAAA
ncbi:hypothetical protein A8A54_04440 [Brucella pseudogrignonensis]|uniref:hypothetical protein n=1 Tax=Brucella pseudogrignonensis TaxID=419475 RepID=UPI0007DA603A|nr:hypothetical protein [Brucella pseudogrignonensis]ANG95800.1 hypothetical protein A8A54_04440 [Brucella pseudogrignonensis]